MNEPTQWMTERQESSNRKVRAEGIRHPNPRLTFPFGRCLAHLHQNLILIGSMLSGNAPPMGQPAARVMDLHTCPRTNGTVPHIGGPIVPPCAPTVLIGFKPAARVTDPCICVGPPDQISSGSSTVLIENKMAARLGDRTRHGGVIITGCSTVVIGGATVEVISPAHGLLENLEDLSEGIQDEAVDMVKGVFHLLTTNPITTGKNMLHAVTHPGEVWDALSEPYKEAIRTGHPMKAVGRGILGIGSMFFGIGEASKVGEATNIASKVAKGSEAAATRGTSKFYTAESAFSYSPKIGKQLEKRGWDAGTVDSTIAKPYATSEAANKATGGSATAYFNKDGSYIVRDNATQEIIQISNRKDPTWVPDPTIKNPYRP